MGGGARGGGQKKVPSQTPTPTPIILKFEVMGDRYPSLLHLRCTQELGKREY